MEMRYSSAHKAKTRSRILKRAAQRFRENGVRGTGIARLMSQLGLTHGGFYGHFENKNDLVAAALSAMCQEFVESLTPVVESAPRGNKLQVLVETYLSPEHRDDPGRGCPFPALVLDITRLPGEVRQSFTGEFSRRMKYWAKYMPGSDNEKRRENAALLFAGMAGTMMIARAVSDSGHSDNILAEARKFYAAAFQRLG